MYRLTIRHTLPMLALSTNIAVQAQDVLNDSIAPTPERELSQAQVTGKRKSVSRMSGAENGFTLSRTELFKAACCNLGESFTTNPSVDVSYSDAATGAKQIKLLGLAGSYVQMLSENIPDFRGAAAPYALGYVPGPWMQSIQVSKGSASVKNGYESITGQINVEYKSRNPTPRWRLTCMATPRAALRLTLTAMCISSKRNSARACWRTMRITLATMTRTTTVFLTNRMCVKAT